MHIYCLDATPTGLSGKVSTELGEQAFKEILKLLQKRIGRVANCIIICFQSHLLHDAQYLCDPCSGFRKRQ